MRRPAGKFATAAALATLALAFLAVGPAGAEQSGRAGLVVTFDGSFSPRHLPRERLVPISLTLNGSVHSTDGTSPPRLNRIELAFGARGGLQTAGLPVCPRARLRNATARQALARCRGALVGRGQISAEIPLNPADPLTTRASLLAFNGRTSCAPSRTSSATGLNEPPHARTRERAFASGSGGHAALIQNPRSAGRDRNLVSLARSRVAARRDFGPAERPADHAQGSRRRDPKCHPRPAVWVHAYSAAPAVSFVLPFHLQRLRTGAFGVLMRSPVGRSLGPWPRLRSFEITLGRRYRAGGELRSYLSARCPLPPRFTSLAVPLARATYSFAPRPTLTTTILRRCRVQP